MNKFPKNTKSQRAGLSAELEFERFVINELGWKYERVHQENDSGIDGYIEVVNDEQAMGRKLAVQIKFRESPFAKSQYGIKYRLEFRHINYYSNSPLPVILVVYDGNFQSVYWTKFDPNKVCRETKNKRYHGWIEIPSDKKLTVNVLREWEEIAGYAHDLVEDMERSWFVDDILSETGHVRMGISSKDVKAGNLRVIKNMLRKMTKTQDSRIKNRGRWSLYFPEYANDDRELYEIPEIRKWFEASIEYGIPWFYFLDTENDTLQYLLLCTCPVSVREADSNVWVLDVDLQEKALWYEKNFENLNRYIDEHSIPEEINKERSRAVIEYFDRHSA